MRFPVGPMMLRPIHKDGPMSRSRECTRCTELEAELRQWKQDYKDLALALAKGQGFPSSALPGVTEATGPHPATQTFSAEPALPGNIFPAIEETTDRNSEARKMAIEWARGALDSGMKHEDVEAQLRVGEEIKI